MKRILLNHPHVRTTVNNRIACYLMILGYFVKDLLVTNTMEGQLYQNLKESRTKEVGLTRLIEDTRKRGLIGEIYEGNRVETSLLYQLLKEKRLIMLGGVSEGNDFEWVVSGFNKRGDFYVTDARIRQKDIYPNKLVDLLSARPEGRWCLVISKNYNE